MKEQRKNQSIAGYTMIEVMMAIGIVTMGAVGIMGLQQASTRGNMAAREVTTASYLNRAWIERLKRDALLWRVGGAGAAAANLTATKYLNNVGAGWFLPPVSGTETATFDAFGVDTTVGANMRYCANVRLSWVVPGQALRADVRIWWHRRGMNAALYPNCGAAGDPNALSGDANLRFVYASTVLRWTSG